MGFPSSLAGKESACNAGDPGSIPGSERSPGEGIGYPLQYSWTSLAFWAEPVFLAQLVKNLPEVISFKSKDKRIGEDSKL